MDANNTKPLIQSETFQWLLATLVVYLIQRFGLPALPSAVQGEVINIISELLTLVIPVMMGMAAKARMKARAIVDSVF